MAAGLPLAHAVAGAGSSIDEGRDALAALGIRTELDYERERAASRPDEPAGTGAPRRAGGS